MLDIFFVVLAETSTDAARKIIELQYVHFSALPSILGVSLLYKEPANWFRIHHLLDRYIAVPVANMSLSIRFKELD